MSEIIQHHKEAIVESGELAELEEMYLAGIKFISKIETPRDEKIREIANAIENKSSRALMEALAAYLVVGTGQEKLIRCRILQDRITLDKTYTSEGKISAYYGIRKIWEEYEWNFEMIELMTLKIVDEKIRGESFSDAKMELRYLRGVFDRPPLGSPSRVSWFATRWLYIILTEWSKDAGGELRDAERDNSLVNTEDLQAIVRMMLENKDYQGLKMTVNILEEQKSWMHTAGRELKEQDVTREYEVGLRIVYADREYAIQKKILDKLGIEPTRNRPTGTVEEYESVLVTRIDKEMEEIKQGARNGERQAWDKCKKWWTLDGEAAVIAYEIIPDRYFDKAREILGEFAVSDRQALKDEIESALTKGNITMAKLCFRSAKQSWNQELTAEYILKMLESM